MGILSEPSARALRLAYFTIDRASDAVLWVDADARIYQVNETACRIFGFAREELLGRKTYELHPQENEAIWRRRWKNLQEKKVQIFEKSQPTKDGRWIPVEVTQHLIEFEGQEFSCSFVRDISERKRTENALRESEEKYRNLVELANDGIIILQDHLVKYVNPRFRKVFGFAADDMFDVPIVDLIHPDELPHTMERYRRHLAENDIPAMYESALFHHDGHKIPVEFNVGYIPWQGKPAFIIEIRDIAERKKAEQDLKRALQEVEQLKNRLQQENIYLQHEIKLTHNFEEIITQNQVFKALLEKVEQVASTDATVLILGETGTGKELLARAIHNISTRRHRPLVKVNCAALPANLVESELFGHEKGAFTGALTRKIGRFELADGGTIFLDEIGDLSMDLQVKLLRVLQDGEFERLGSSQTLQVDVRVIAATNRNLEKALENRTFREDLFYRLNVFPIHITPLRERRDDIPLLVHHFVKKYQNKIGKKIDTIPQKIMESLLAYHWPGNVRELENIIERAVIVSQGNRLELGDWFVKKEPSAEETVIIETLEELEKNHILKALQLTHWRVSGEKGAAKLLGVNPQTLVSRMKRLGIHRQEVNL